MNEVASHYQTCSTALWFIFRAASTCALDRKRRFLFFLPLLVPPRKPLIFIIVSKLEK